MFFQSMNQMMTPNVDITLVIRKSAEGRMAVSVLPKSNTLKDEAQNSIVPLTLNGTPEELDSGFMQVVARPMQKASGLISNMAQFEAQANKAASSSKGAKEAKTKESKEDREKREKYEKNLKKAEEHIAAKRHKEAVDALTEARKYAKPDDLKTIDERLDEQKKLVGQGDLFAMMEEPEQAQPQQPQVQQPVQQPATAQVQQPQAQPLPMPGPVPQVQQQTVQQTGPQQQPTMPQQEMPAQAAHPAQQPYGNPGQGYGGQYGYPQQPQGWPQQAHPNGGYPQYAHQNGGMTPPNGGQHGTYPPNGQPRYAQQPMPFEHDMAAHAPRMADPDDAPPYRPEEYADYPDFPASMLQGNYVQPQMM